MTNEPTHFTRPQPTALGRPGQAMHGLQRKAGVLVRYLAAHKAWFFIPCSLFMGLGLASCTDRDEAAGSLTAVADATTAQITLYISMSDAASTRAATRADDATWGSDYTSAEATTFENTISSLQVLFFNEDGSLAAAAEKRLFWSYGEDGDQYEYVGTIDVSNAAFTTTTTNDDGSTSTSFSGKVMVLANCPDAASFLEEKTSSTDTDLTYIGSLTYKYADITEETGLPMWGMTTANGLTFASGYNTSLGTISLLRAVSKILVTFDDDTYADGFSLTGLAVNRYLDAGYCLPTGYTTVDATTDLGQETCQNVYEEAGTVVGTSTVTTTYTYTDDDGNTTTSTTTSDSSTLTGQVTTVSTTYAYADGSACSDTLLWFSADNGGRILYLPEYDNTNSSEHVTLTLAISRTVENGEDDTFNPYTGSMTLTLQEYASSTSTTTNNSSAASTASGDHYGLVRNHQYAFTLTQIDNSTLSVVSTDDWDSSTSDVGWDVDDAVVSFLAAKGSYDDAEEGDEDAVYCLLNYPRWSNTAHSELNTSSSSFASYELTVTCDYGQITWAAYLDKNEEFFNFSTGQTTSDDLGLGHTNYRGSTTGVSRSTPYLIKLSCAKKWSELQKLAHPDDGGTPTLTPQSDGTIWMETDTDGFDPDDEETVYNNVDVIYYDTSTDEDGNETTTYYKLVALYADLFILAKGTASDQVKALPINPTVGSTVGTTTVSTSLFTPNWFPGGTNSITATVDGTTITLSDNEWVRIYQARASLSTTADGGNTYDSVSEFISNYSPEGEQYWLGN